MFRSGKWILPVFVFTICILASCSSLKFVPEDHYLLKKTTIQSEDSVFDGRTLYPYVHQRPNTKWFSVFKVPLSLYSLSGRDSTVWMNRFLRRLGEPPVVYDSIESNRTLHDMTSAMQSKGYLNAEVSRTTTSKKRRAHVNYTVRPGHLYTIGNVVYESEDPTLEEFLHLNDPNSRGLKTGMDFSSENLDNERKRIVKILADKGFYKFNKDFIHFDVDSTGKGGTVDVKLRIIKYRASNNGVETNHKQYFINGIRYASGDGKPFIPLRQKVLVNNTYVEEGQPFSATALQDTYNKFGRLQAVKYTNIHFTELPDTNLLNCDIQISTRKPNSISFQPEGTNTAGDLGAAVSLTYENNNLFRGSELFSIQLRGAFEAISGLDGYQNKDYEEYNVETKLMFPRIIAPFLTKRFKKELNLQSELLFSYNLQNRPEFHRRVLTGAWRYHWKNNRRHRSYRFDLLDINYVHMPWISQTFKTNYLDDVSSRNAILKYNYEDLFILKTGINFHYNNGKHAVRSNFEIGGNLLSAISHILGDKKNAEGQYTLFNIAYAQYVKGDFDYTRVLTIDTKNTLAMHVGLGIAYPYGNSKVLPFEKRYFSGGANSVRGWGVRELGPGRYKGTDGNIDFINQTGDMKLDLNAELRTFLFWKFNGAFFVDAGNIWTLKYYEEQKGGQFRFDEFYKQIAVSYGLGLRLNLDYFVIRLDMGMKAINPVYDNKRQHFPILNPNFGRDMALHFAVGLPF